MIDINLKNIDAKHMAGMNIGTSPANSNAHQIWKAFMPRRKELSGPEDDVFYSLQDYPDNYPWEAFDPTATFTTWAAREINSNSDLPDGFSSTLIKGGLYAVWTHQGTAATISNDIMYFFSKWLPNSGYMLDKSRKHFEALGKDYLGPDNPESKEEVFIPILPNTDD